MHDTKNQLPSDPLAQEVDEFFEAANEWLKDAKEITLPVEADALSNVIAGINDLNKRIEISRKAEAKPFDDGKAEVQKRYKSLTDRTERVKAAILKKLTTWRNGLVVEQAAKANALRIAAEAAADKAAHVADVAGDDLGAQEIADNAAEDARKIAKAADRAETKVGTGLRTRTVWDYEFIDGAEGMKLAIVFIFNNEREEMIAFLERRIASRSSSARRDVPGVNYTSRKEAY